jgi:hypothetical protein
MVAHNTSTAYCIACRPTQQRLFSSPSEGSPACCPMHNLHWRSVHWDIPRLVAAQYRSVYRWAAANHGSGDRIINSVVT